MLTRPYKLAMALGCVTAVLSTFFFFGAARGGKPVSTTGRPISFVRHDPNSFYDVGYDVKLARTDGSGLVKVNSDVLRSWPRWSPDGAMIGGYFKDLTDSAGNWVDTALMVMAPDGSSERIAISGAEFDSYNLSRSGILASNLPPKSPFVGQGNYATWFGNDALIFAGYGIYDPSFFGESDPSYATSGLRLFIVDADGNVYPVTETPIQNSWVGGTGAYHDYHPDWSPVLNKIVFASNRMGYYELYAINPDGTGLVQITDFQSGPSPFPVSKIYQPRWSPDGRRIALRVDVQTSAYYNVWILDVDLSQADPGLGGRVLSIDPFKNQAKVDEQMPAWSPAGDYLLFNRNIGRPYRSQIIMADAVTGEEAVVIDSAQLIAYPDWKPVP